MSTRHGTLRDFLDRYHADRRQQGAPMPNRVPVPGPWRYHELPPGTVYIGRNCFGYPRSPFYNPYPVPKPGETITVTVDGETVQVRDRDHSIDLYVRYLDHHPELDERGRTELPGRDLACWCKPYERCHGDALIARFN
jgi:glutaminase